MRITKKQARDIRDLVQQEEEKYDALIKSLEKVVDGQMVWKGSESLHMLKITNRLVHQELTYMLYDMPEKGGKITNGDEFVEITSKDCENFIKLLEFCELLCIG